MSTQPCPRCDGTGVIETGQCPVIVHGRQCRFRVLDAEDYFELFPEREHLRGLCGFHRNACVRGELRSLAQSADSVD